MTLTQSPPRIASVGGATGDPEALFREARRRRRRRWVLGSGAVTFLAASLVAGVLLAGGMSHGGGPSASVTSPNRSDPGTPVLRNSTSSFAVAAKGLLANAFDCPSKTTCFAVAYPQPGDALHDWASSMGRNQVAKTADGGVTWTRVPDFPRQWTPEPVMSCPTVTMCVVAVQAFAPHNNMLPARRIAVTHDGGSTWTIRTLALPPDLVDASARRIVCTSESYCLVYVTGRGSSGPLGVFLSSSDSATRWVEATGGDLPAAEVVSLRCDQDGQCVALADSGTGMVTLTGVNFGAAWTQGSRSSDPTSPIVNASCGDATHCMYSTLEGGLVSTENAGETWVVSDVPIPKGQIITAVDCANGEDCFVAAARWHAGNYTLPVVYRTSDDGQSWTDLKVPSRMEGLPTSTVVPLSCPSSAGCVGIAQASSQSSRPLTKRFAISTFR